MNILKAYGRGFKNSLRHPRMILLIFAITLLLGLSVALPFFFSFKSAVGNSVVTNLDYTTMSELVKFHSWNLDSIISQGKFSVLIFWLIMIFFVGGIVRTFNREDFTVGTFFSGAGVNFFRFLLCDVIVLALLAVTAAVLFGISSFLLSLFHNVVTETPLMWAYGIATFIFLCVVALFLMISDYAKFYMEMAGTSRVLKAIGKGIKFVFSNFLRTYFLYALLLVLPILTLILYKLTFDRIGMNTTFGIIAMFFVQQLFIILRVWYRIWSLSSQFELYADDYVQVITYDLDIKKVEKSEVTESEPEPVVDQVVISKTTEVETIIVNSEGDTFTKPADSEDIVTEPADGDTFTKPADGEDVVIETVVETKTESEPEPEPEVEEQLSKFYAEDQGDGTECNLADLTPEPETKVEVKESEPEVKVVVNETEPEVKVVINETEPETKETEVTETTETKVEEVVVVETTVINNEGDTFTKIVDSQSDSADVDSVVEPADTVNVTILGEPIVSDDSDIKNDDEEVPEPDDIDEELLAQYYSEGESDSADELVSAESKTDDNHEVIDIDDMDESVGSAVPLDVEDDDDDSTTVTTTTTTTTTTVTTTTTETSSDPDEPRVIKIYTEQEMRDIARKQLEDAGIKPDMALTEVVSEDMPDGVISGEQRSDDQFVERKLKDGEDFADPNGDAKG